MPPRTSLVDVCATFQAINTSLYLSIRVLSEQFVAGPTAPFGPARTLFACAWIKVASIEGFLGYSRQSVGIFNQPLPNSISSFGSFPVKQLSILAVANLFHCDFLLLNLEQQLHPALQSVSQRCKKLIRDLQAIRNWTNQQ